MSGFKGLAQSTYVVSLSCLVAALPAPAFAQATSGAVDSVAQLRAELTQARAQIAEQSQRLTEQQRRLDLMEQRLSGLAQTTQQIRNEALAAATPATTATPVTGAAPRSATVGEPPRDSDRPPVVAVLDQQGSVVTRKGELVGEIGIDYTRADNNRVLFRGTGLVAGTVLVGVFDINEARQDLLNESVTLRYGLTDRLEVGVRVPFVYRSDKLITVPIQVPTGNDPENPQAGTLSSSRTTATAKGMGDIEISARYQLNRGGGGRPYLIAGIQAAIPTGRDPYEVPRNNIGLATRAATGAGFYTISPSITAILPSEPAVLFGTLGYSKNIGRNVNTLIGQNQIDRVEPGDQITFAGGIGVSLNDRTSMNFGYSHAYVFGTKTIRRIVDPEDGPGDPFEVKDRSLQVGRMLFGISHRFTEKLQVNWTFEIGATEDAPDMRTSLRIPIRF